MSLLKRFKLYDQKKEWTVTVIPLSGRDGYRNLTSNFQLENKIYKYLRTLFQNCSKTFQK